MRADREFVRNWYAWIRLEQPVQSFRTGNRKAPGYDTECQIDHLCSRIYSVGSDFLGGAEMDYVRRAESLIRDIDQEVSRIGGEPLRAEQSGRYIAFLSASRQLLTALRESAADAVPG